MCRGTSYSGAGVEIRYLLTESARARQQSKVSAGHRLAAELAHHRPTASAERSKSPTAPSRSFRMCERRRVVKVLTIDACSARGLIGSSIAHDQMPTTKALQIPSIETYRCRPLAVRSTEQYHSHSPIRRTPVCRSLHQYQVDEQPSADHPRKIPISANALFPTTIVDEFAECRVHQRLPPCRRPQLQKRRALQYRFPPRSGMEKQFADHRRSVCSSELPTVDQLLSRLA